MHKECFKHITLASRISFIGAFVAILFMRQFVELPNSTTAYLLFTILLVQVASFLSGIGVAETLSSIHKEEEERK